MIIGQIKDMIMQLQRRLKVIKYLYIDDFEDKNAWINICKMFGIFLDNNLRCIKTNYIIEEIEFKATNIKAK